MASKVLCVCGTLISIDLFEGNEVQLLISEKLMDIPAATGLEMADRVIHGASVVATCKKCGVLSFIDSNLNIKRFSSLN